jgi:hypothetical protein
MILTGLTLIIVIEIYAAIMQMEFQTTDNNVGKGFAILGIYLFCLTCKPCRLLLLIRKFADIQRVKTTA